MGFVHPMPELRLGGSLQRTGEGTANAVSLAFERAKGNKNTLRTPEDAVLPDTALAPWLASLQREAYERMYGLDHDRLVAGGADILAASDDIGRLLFQSAAGIEHLGDTLQKLELEADALWAPRKAGSRLYYQARDDFEAAGKDLYGDVQRVTGDSRVQTNILLPSDTDPAPVLDGLAASKIDVYQALKSVADRAVEQAPAGDGAKAVVREAARSRIEDIMSNGFFVQAGNGYAFFDPYVGQPVSDETGKPLIFDEKTVEERGKAAPPPGEGDMGARLDPVARKMMGLDLMPQDAWKPFEAAQ